MLVVKVKDSPHPLGGWLFGVLSWLDILTPLAFDRWILCTALYGGNGLFLSLPLSSQASVPPLLALHLQVASWCDKLRQCRGCGSLNQRSLHAFSASFPFFFLQRRKEATSAAHLPGGNESQTTPGLFSRGFSVAELQGHWHKLSALIAAPLKPLAALLCVYFSFF